MNWHLLGVKLGLEDHELRAIDSKFHGNDEQYKHEILSHLLRSPKLSTWKVVADTLYQMGEHKVASKIRAKYCTDTGTGMYLLCIFEM